MLADHVVIGKNKKAVLSANFGLSTCRPTKRCIAYCYGRGRTKEIAARCGTTPNSGPITWRVQQAAYERNVQAASSLALMGNEALAKEANKIAKKVRRAGLDNLRWNGLGDLFLEVLPLILHISALGVKVWGFSRKPDLITDLALQCDEWGVATRPYFLGSLDSSTLLRDAQRLREATARLNGEPALAYATEIGGAAGCAEVDNHPEAEYIKVVFGYHANQVHTIIGHRNECPATSLKDADNGVCQRCRRCIGE